MSAAIIVLEVTSTNVGELEVELAGSERVSGPVKVITVRVLDAETRARSELDIVVSHGPGAELLRALLTEDQWEAVLNA